MTTCVLAGSKIDGKTKISYDSGLAGGIAPIETQCLRLAGEFLLHSENFQLVSVQSGIDSLNVIYNCMLDNRDYHVTIKAVD